MPAGSYTLPVIVVVPLLGHETSHVSPAGHAMPPSPGTVIPLELPVGKPPSPKLPLLPLPLPLPPPLVLLLPLALPLPPLPLPPVLPPLVPPLLLVSPKPLPALEPPHAGIDAAAQTMPAPTSAGMKKE